MPTIDDLKSTYSFIASFQASAVLAQYGDNALPLYAVGLFLGVEDFGSFATEALTDHPEDKKADIIHIDESVHMACIAQGYTGNEWGKAEAKANKADDLNTAVAWLLQVPIAEVPDVIREQAKLLREGIADGVIQKLVIAYAHNALESINVGNALQGVRHLLVGLELLKGIEVEVVELGLKRIEALFLSSEGVIQISDDIQLESNVEITSHVSPNWVSHTFPLSGLALFQLYEDYGDALFSANLRDFLGVRKTSGNVNNRIKETAETKPENFYILNNGITIVNKKADLSSDKKILSLHGLSIVNGAQTTGAVHAAGSSHSSNISVLTRVITVGDEKLISEIVAGNNTQNSITASDRRSNDPVQIRIAGEFASKGIEYVHRRSSSRKPKSALFADSVGQALCAFSGDLQTAIRAKADIFESESTYAKVFPVTLSIGHVFAIQTLSWAYDQFKGQLRAKVESKEVTDIQGREFRLLNYPASKQFLISVIGELREEIAGRKLPDRLGFELKPDDISTNPQEVINAWDQVLQAVLPLMVQNLPAGSDEYQVVRSTEHMQSVAKSTKGIVAGVPILQSSFTSLRDKLKEQ
jgi:hypothetical protein